jgi:hypothetical protein
VIPGNEKFVKAFFRKARLFFFTVSFSCLLITSWRIIIPS